MTRSVRQVLASAAILAAVSVSTAPASAGEMQVADLGGIYNVKMTTWQERKFQAVIRQQFDYSCGSAALATLLTHHYGVPAKETEVFRDMFERGDQDKIKDVGFSLYDMQQHLARRGFKSNGYRTSLDRLLQADIPAIALINPKGYSHFVVVKGLRDDRIVIADPNQGTRIMARAEFEAVWNGIIFVITDEPDRSLKRFNRDQDWNVQARAPIGTALDRASLAGFMLMLPGSSFF